MENTPQNPYNSPATANTMATSNGIYVKPTLIQALFSFQGRFSRTQFWINSLILTGAFVALMIVVGIAGAINPELAGIAALLLGIPMYIVVIWASLAISVKRWHDRNKSGWWVLIGLIPIVGPIWAFIETGFLEGTSGDNQFGPDPLS